VDWQAWHDDYDRPGSELEQRLRMVQDRIRAALDASPPGPLRVVSMCAGQGRDLLEVLPDHPRRDDVTARLVEWDPRSTARAEAAARAAGLERVEVVTGDAAVVGAYTGLVPADLVLACGVFGNVLDADIEATVDCCRQLCAPGGTVVWTRHRGGRDRVPVICDWFEQRGFERVWLSGPDIVCGVGAHRFAGPSVPLEPARRMFTFVGYDVLEAE
jgi:SAM-dependent methyltransferase